MTFAFCLPTSSEGHFDRKLHLAWIADAGPQEAVEVEERRGRQRVDVVRVVERVEHLDGRRDRHARVQAERPRQTPIEAEVLVVLAQRVASEIDAVDDARTWRDRLRAPCLRARVQLERAGKPIEAEE